MSVVDSPTRQFIYAKYLLMMQNEIKHIFFFSFYKIDSVTKELKSESACYFCLVPLSY